MTTGHLTGLPANTRPAPSLAKFREEMAPELEAIRLRNPKTEEKKTHASCDPKGKTP